MNYNAHERAEIRDELNSFLERAKGNGRLRPWTEVYGPLILELLNDIDELQRKLAIERVEQTEYQKRVEKLVTTLEAEIRKLRQRQIFADTYIKGQAETVRRLHAQVIQKERHLTAAGKHIMTQRETINLLRARYSQATEARTKRRTGGLPERCPCARW
jgi:putative cell wall-binding protein